MRYGLIGARLGHSHSPAIHALLAPYRYELFEMEAREIAAFLRQADIGGVNVTIPYKQTVLPLCDVLTEEAERIGSVNTIVRGADGRLTGDNTDCYGFSEMLRRAGIDIRGKKTLILGSGGTSRTARAAALALGAGETLIVSRTGEISYANLARHADAEILINTTPVGMYPNNDAKPLSLDGFPKLSGVVDVIYNPLRTALLVDAAQRGIPTAGGLSMLVFQAVRAAERFTGAPIPDTRAEAALQAIRQKVESIVLIGMPGCGKSRIGEALSRLTGRTLVDTDLRVLEMAGKDIPRIFAEDGEGAFRAYEKRAIWEAAMQGGVILATGGGAVMDLENASALRQNGRVYHITRPLSLLDAKGRPLSRDLAALEQKRMPVYRANCDREIANDKLPEDAAQRIWEDFLCAY